MSSLTVDTNCKVIETLGPNLSLVEYSAKSVAVIGDTKPHKDTLKELGGKWNSRLKCGPGWIYPKTKVEEIIKKMIEGRMRKYYEEVCLLDQTFVIDGESELEKVLEDAGKEAGKPVSVSAFGLFVLGEGIEKKKEDFAAEVAAAVGD